jgi:hypothetical protein
LQQYFILFLLIGLLSGQEARDKRSTFWIIENPAALVLFNQYEQRITEHEKNVLPDHSAWRIIDKDYVFSDQFTRTVKTSLNRNTYFIQIDEEGTPVNKELSGSIEIIKNVRIQSDTVRIITDDRLSLKHGTTTTSLSTGMLIERLFQYRRKTFGRDISRNISGWIVGNGPANWEIYIPDNSDLALEKQLFDRVDHIMTSFNKRIDNLFAFLNNRYGFSNLSPQWNIERSEAYLKYTLTPRSYMKQFTQSQSYLVQELSDLLYGSNYQLSATDGQIIILKSSR